jgi:putative ABC transport system permease protein
VRVYRGGLLDWRERRVWVIAPPRDAAPLVPSSQLVEGDLRRGERRVRVDGWLVLSQALAQEHHLRIGQAFTLPSPDPDGLSRGGAVDEHWLAPGAIVMNASDFARAWGCDDASAYNVLLDASVTPAQGAREIRQVLGPGSGLAVQSAEQHAARQRALSRAGLARLTQIAVLIMIGAVLAMAAAMGTMVWQRRPRLAKLKLEGLGSRRRWRWRTEQALTQLSEPAQRNNSRNSSTPAMSCETFPPAANSSTRTEDTEPPRRRSRRAKGVTQKE